MSTGITVYNGATTQFTTKSPAILVDRTAKYGYRNFQLTFTTDPTQPPAPPDGNEGSQGIIYSTLISIRHGLNRIPAFESVTIGYGLPNVPLSGTVSIWNEDAMLTQGSPSGNDFYSSTWCWNQLLFRTDTQNLYIVLYRTSTNDFNPTTGNPYAVYPYSLAGVQLNINTQIFAMGLNDSLSQV